LLVIKQDIKYLGVHLDNGRKFTQHLEKVCGKADTLEGALRILLPKVNEPAGSVRKLYYEVWESVATYVVPI
jgi:hypothetical protein